MFGFMGYMLMVDGRIFPNDYIALDTWNTSPDKRTDEDSYTNGNGELVRNILPHKRTTITFNTVDGLHLSEKTDMQSFFNRDKTTMTYWNDEKNQYETGTFYVVDPQYPIKQIVDDSENSDIIYGPITVEIIEY